MEEVKDINELIHDDHNFNRGTSLGNKLLKSRLANWERGAPCLLTRTIA